MRTRILVPLDESRWSRDAADLAIGLAARAPEPAELVGLHVVNVTQLRGRLVEDLAGLLGFEPVVVPGQIERHYRERGRRLLDDFAARCEAAGLSCETVLEVGAVVDRILRRADRADLLVMGLRGETEERAPGQGGGTAERVLRRVGATALVVPRGLTEVHGILLGFDDSRGAWAALRAAGALAEWTGAPVHVVHVAPRGGSDLDLDEVARRLSGAGVPVETAVVDGEPQEALAAEAVARGCDVIAIGYRGRSRLKDIFLGRTTEWLVGHVDIGLLVAR